MLWIKFNDNRILKKHSINVIINVTIKTFFLGRFFNMTSFGGDHLNISLHNIMMQYLFGS
jgi:hypothetical protein